jgi:hypothetical protein
MRIRAALVIVLVVLAAVFVLLRFGFDRRHKVEPLFPDFHAGSAARIVIEGRDTTAVLEKADDTWIVTSEDSFPAEAEAVQNLLDHITSFSRKDIISTNPQKRSIYQVDTTGIAVSIQDAQGDTLVRFIVGKVGPDYQSTYVRDAASNEVVLASGYLPPAFDRGKRSWQDKTVYSIDPEMISEIGVNRPEGSLALARDASGQWYLSQPESTGCNQDRVTRMVRTVAYLRCDDFAGRGNVGAWGLEQADSSVWFRTTDGTEERLLLGNEAEGRRVYARKADSDIVYVLPIHRVEGMLPKPAELVKEETGEERVP